MLPVKFILAIASWLGTGCKIFPFPDPMEREWWRKKMNNLLNIKTPSEGQASAIRSDFGLDYLGLSNLHKIYWDLPAEALYEEIIFRNEASISHWGPIVVSTGKHTARAAGDKFVVRESETEENIWWGQYNRPFGTEKFNELFIRLQGYLQGRDIFVQDCYGGADPDYRLQ